MILIQWKRGSNWYLILPGNRKINYVALRIQDENTLASDKGPSLLFSYWNVYFKRIPIELAKGIKLYFGADPF